MEWYSLRGLPAKDGMFKQGLWLYAARVLAMVAGLLSQVLMARLGGAEGYGVFSTMMGMVLLANGLADFGVPLNGPKRLIAGETQWVANAQSLRRSLSIASAAIYAVACFVFYKAYAFWLILGLPLVLFQFLQIDWIFRATQLHAQAAMRQMMQSILVVASLALLAYGEVSWWWSLLAVATVAPITYLIYWHKGGEWRYASPLWLPHKALFREQSQVFTGQLAHQATYALPTLALLPFGGAAANGILASHYLLFTSLGGFSLITIDLFMARKGHIAAEYARWMWLVSLPAFLGIALGGLYYPLLFSGRGLAWQSQLIWPLLAVVAVHTARLIQLNGFLFRGDTASYRNLGLIALVLHLCAWVVMVTFFKVNLNATTALWLLVMSEAAMLIWLNFGKKIIRRDND